MPSLQIVNIRDSKVKFVNQDNDPIQSLSHENAELLFQNAMQDMKIQTQETQIQSLQDENAELLFRVANIELGGNL